MPIAHVLRQLKKPMSPVVGLLSLAAVSVISFAILYFGIPGTGFRGVQTGIFFPFEVEFADARFMDHTIKCESKEVTAEVRKALQKVKPDYPVAKAYVTLTTTRQVISFTSPTPPTMASAFLSAATSGSDVVCRLASRRLTRN